MNVYSPFKLFILLAWLELLQMFARFVLWFLSQREENKRNSETATKKGSTKNGEFILKFPSRIFVYSFPLPMHHLRHPPFTRTLIWTFFGGCSSISADGALLWYPSGCTPLFREHRPRKLSTRVSRMPLDSTHKFASS